MAPFSHEKVAEPPNLQSLRGAISPARVFKMRDWQHYESLKSKGKFH